MACQKKKLSEILFSLEDIGEWKDEFEKRKDKITRLLEKIDERNDTFYPYPEDVFNSFRKTPLEKVTVVIWGQDPYPKLLRNGKTRAQGYAFGVSREDSVPGSLKNIYKEMSSCFDSFSEPNHGDLTWLCDQGIFFMNSALTYNPEDPKSHQGIWMRFTHIIIDIINKKLDNCIHILWGSAGKKLSDSIASKNILEASHPSPLSAYRGFFGCRHFEKINILLDRQGKKQINWNEDHTLPPTFVEKLSSK